MFKEQLLCIIKYNGFLTAAIHAQSKNLFEPYYEGEGGWNCQVRNDYANAQYYTSKNKV